MCGRSGGGGGKTDLTERRMVVWRIRLAATQGAEAPLADIQTRKDSKKMRAHASYNSEKIKREKKNGGKVNAGRQTSDKGPT